MSLMIDDSTRLFPLARLEEYDQHDGHDGDDKHADDDQTTRQLNYVSRTLKRLLPLEKNPLDLRAQVAPRAHSF